MGHAAGKLDAQTRDAGPGAVIPFKQPGPSGAVGNDPRIDLPSLLGAISRAAGLLGAQKERVALLEKRCAVVEEQLKIASARIAESEARLKTAQEEARAERARATDMHRRSAEVVEKSRAMLTEASTRVRAAEARAERAEGSVASLRDAFERQIGPQLP